MLPISTSLRELCREEPPIYKINFETDNKLTSLIKKVFSFLIFPIALYNCFHHLSGKICFLPAARRQRAEVIEGEHFNQKRITLKVDGYEISAMIVTPKNFTPHPTRWVLGSFGNGMCYEQVLNDPHDEFKKILTRTSSCGIVFNFPGVQLSSHGPSREGMIKATKAALAYLEDSKKGAGATQIICYGHSISGGIQNEVFSQHQPKEGIKYVLVKSRTFSTMADTAAELPAIKRSCCLRNTAWVLTKLFGWDINPLAASKKIKLHQVIVQTAQVLSAQVIANPDLIIDDGIIGKTATLAYHLLHQRSNSNSDTLIIGIKETHNQYLQDATIDFLSNRLCFLIKKDKLSA